MKKFQFTNEQVLFLYSILNNPQLCPMTDLASMRKLNTFFDVIEESVKKYESRLNAIKRKYEFGRDLTYAEQETADLEAKPIAEQGQDYTCDRESFKYVQETLEQAAKKGEEVKLGGRQRVRLFVEVMDQMDKAQLVESKKGK